MSEKTNNANNQKSASTVVQASQKRDSKQTPVDLKKKTGKFINLIPPLSLFEKKKATKKENINLSSALLIFFVMLFTVSILLANYYFRISIKQSENTLTSTEKELDSQSAKELLLKNVVSKYESIASLKEQDLQYYYFSNKIGDFPENIKVKTLSLTENQEFELSGLAIDEDNYDDFVVLLEEDEDFTDVNIILMKALTDKELRKAREQNEGSYSIQWRLSGIFSKNNGE